jgi:hypothetical protein
LDKPLHVIYTVSKLAYRIKVILIANKRVKKIITLDSKPTKTRSSKTSIKRRKQTTKKKLAN